MEGLDLVGPTSLLTLKERITNKWFTLANVYAHVYIRAVNPSDLFTLTYLSGQQVV